MDIIRFLRYFLIDYPPPVLAMYETSMPTSDLIPNINFDEEEADGTLPDIFIKYKLSIYSFNNNGNIWTETFAYIAVGLCVSFLMKLFKTSKNRYFLLILLICRLVFVWNYALSYFLSQFMGINLSTFVSYRFPTRNTPTGFYNYIFSIVTGFLLLSGYIFCFYMIKKMRPMLYSKSLDEEERLKMEKDRNLLSTMVSTPANNQPTSIIFPEPKSPFLDLKSPHSIIKRKDYQNDEGNKEKVKTGRSVAFDISFNKKDEKKSDVFGEININNDNGINQRKINIFKKADIEVFSDNKKLQKKFHLDKKNSTDITMKHESIIHSKISNSKIKKNDWIANTLEEIKETNRSNLSEIKEEIPNEIIKCNKKGILSSFLSLFEEKKIESLDWSGKENEALQIKLELLNKSFFPLHKDFKHTIKIQSYYILLDLMRQSLFSLLVVLMYDNPFSGLIIVNIINVCFMISVLLIRPFKYVQDFIQNILNEACLSISCIAALIMTSMEKFEIIDLDLKMNLGWIMVMTNTLLLVLFVIRMAMNFIWMIFFAITFIFRSILNKFRENKNKNKEEIHVNIQSSGESDDQAILQQILEIQGFLR